MNVCEYRNIRLKSTILAISTNLACSLKAFHKFFDFTDSKQQISSMPFIEKLTSFVPLFLRSLKGLKGLRKEEGSKCSLSGSTNAEKRKLKTKCRVSGCLDSMEGQMLIVVVGFFLSITVDTFSLTENCDEDEVMIQRSKARVQFLTFQIKLNKAALFNLRVINQQKL
jgi:hypothetical protein